MIAQDLEPSKFFCSIRSYRVGTVAGLDYWTHIAIKCLVQCRTEAKCTYSLSCMYFATVAPQHVEGSFLKFLEVKGHMYT